MKIFVYKTLFVFICLFLFYKFTIDAKINEYEKKFELLQSDYGREIIREKVREEVRKSLKKDTILNPEDKELFKKLIDKLKNELN
tara:strand:- start:65 stop:319 length:255 start_codon:yes stop_codon:yes gene_type:complete